MEIALAIVGVVVVALVVFLAMRKKSGEGGKAIPSSKPPPPDGEHAPRNMWLVGIEGGVEGRAFLIGNRTMTIGRAPTNLIQVDDDDVSRVHTRVEPEDGYLQITDLKSYNGTHVQGERVTEARMTVGQTLRVGAATFRVELDVDAPDAARSDKAADAQKFQATVAGDGDDIADKLKAALAETGGDFEEAARRIGADPEVLRHIAAARGIQV